MHVLTLSYILIYVPSVKVDTQFVPTAAELRGITIKIIRVRFLATLLRFSDELDISYKRAPIKILEILQEEMPDYSRLQWLKHYYTSGVKISVYSAIKRGRITNIKIDFQYPDRELGTKVGEMIFAPIQESFNEVKMIFLQNGLNINLHSPHLLLNETFVKIPDHISEKFLNSKYKVPLTMPDTKEYDDEYKNVPQMKQHEVDLSNLAEAVEEIGTHYEIVGATNASTITTLYATSVDNPSILYYDLEDNVGNESILIPIYPDLTIPKGELIYTTESWRENIAFGGDKYIVIDRNATNWIIARKLIDEHEEDSHLLRVRETIILLNGWSITVLEVDVEGEKAWLSLNKDGEEVNNQVVREGEDFIYTLDLDVPNKTKVLNFTMETVFAGMNTTLVKINSINLISTDTLKINNNNTNLIDGYIIKIKQNQIIVKNNTDIRLLRGNITNIIGNFFTVRVNEAGNGVALVKQIVLQ
jgi:S-layer protein (TIGR01567 family)